MYASVETFIFLSLVSYFSFLSFHVVNLASIPFLSSRASIGNNLCISYPPQTPLVELHGDVAASVTLANDYFWSKIIIISFDSSIRHKSIDYPFSEDVKVI